MLEVQPWMGRGIRCVGSRFTFGEHTCNMYAIHVLFNWMSVSGPEKGPNPLFENCCAPSAKLSNLRNGKLCSAGAMILPMSILSNSESEIDTVPPGATSSLRAAAFGDVPAHVPPWTASAPEEHWLRAVALGGQSIQCCPRRTGTGEAVGLTGGMGVARREHRSIVPASTRVAPRCRGA